MRDLVERADKVAARVMDILEQRVFDGETQQDLRGLLQSVQLLGGLLQLEKDSGDPCTVTVIMEGGLDDLAG